MSKVICEREDLVAVADAIRSKTGETDSMTLGEIPNKINGISTSESEDKLVSRLNIGTYINNNVFALGDHVFYEANSLTALELYQCIEIGDSACSGCHNLTYVYVPKCTFVGNYVFHDCDSLETIFLPKCTILKSGAFLSCLNLNTVELPMCTTLEKSVFEDCKKLNTLILGASTLCTLGADALCNTGIHNNTGYIYVPENLIEEYKADSNWKTYYTRIKPIGWVPTENITFTLYCEELGINRTMTVTSTTWGDFIDNENGDPNFTKSSNEILYDGYLLCEKTTGMVIFADVEIVDGATYIIQADGPS